MKNKKLALSVIAALFVCGVTAMQTTGLGATAKKPSGGNPVVVVDWGGCLIGGLAKGKWIEQTDMVAKVRGGEKYKFYSLTALLGEGTGKAAGEIPAGYGVDISSIPQSNGMIVGVANAKWNLTPRKPKMESTSQKVYRDEVAQVLKKNGLPGAPVKVDQVIRIDLDGDGKDEVLVSATNQADPNSVQPSANDYALVMLRKIGKGNKVQTSLLNYIFYPKAIEDDVTYHAEVSGLLDLDGDGAIEIVVHMWYHEGDSLEVHKVSGGKVKSLGGGGCGY